MPRWCELLLMEQNVTFFAMFTMYIHRKFPKKERPHKGGAAWNSCADKTMRTL